MVFLLLAITSIARAHSPFCDFHLQKVFQFPPQAQIAEIPEENIQYLNGDSSTNVSNKNPYQYSLDRIRNEGIKHLLNSGPIPPRLVFYPMAGSDAGALVRLFPDSHFYIGTCETPFIDGFSKASQRTIRFSDFRQDKFRNVVDLDVIREAHIDLLGSLVGYNPQIRIRGVLAINIPGEPKIERHYGEVQPSHGVIAFDQGEGTKIQYYIHVNVFFQESIAGFKKFWWNQIFNEFSPIDAILVKASMFAFSPQDAHSLPTLRRKIHAALSQNRGLLVEALEMPRIQLNGNVISMVRSLFETHWEFGRNDFWAHRQHIIVDQLTFGYPAPGKGAARVTRF